MRDMLMTVCGGWSLARREDTGTRAITMWCHSWQCADCRPFRLSALKRMATDGCPTSFMTLTVNPRVGQSPDDRAQELSDAFKVLVKRARRKWTKAPLEYMAVFEETKRGEPHLHIIMRAPYIPQSWLSDTMRELIQSPIVDIRAIGSMRGVAKYVAKYVAKGPRAFAKMKRYWSSRGYGTKPEPKPGAKDGPSQPWVIVKHPLWWLVETWRTTLSQVADQVSATEVFLHDGPAARAGPWR